MILAVEMNQKEFSKFMFDFQERAEHILNEANENDLMVTVSALFKGTPFESCIENMDIGFVLRKGEG